MKVEIIFPCAIPAAEGLRVTLEIVFCIYETFHNNFEIKNDFTKYLKESCWLCSD